MASILPPLNVEGKRIAVVGTGMTGLAAARELMRLGAQVTLYDTRAEDELRQDVLPEIGSLGCAISLGCPGGLDRHDLVVTSPGLAIAHPFFECARTEGVEVISEIELAYRLWPGSLIVAITGTNGKSTTTALTGAILRETGRMVRVCGNIGSPMIRHMAEASNEPGTVFVAEVSSFQLEATRFFRPRAAALLNLSDDHADRHEAAGEYLAAKARAFACQGPSDTAVLNAEDAHCVELWPTLPGRVVFFSTHRRVNRGMCVSGGRIMWIEDDSEEVLCESRRIRLIGTHNVENVLAACALARALVPDVGEAVGRALDAFEPAPHTFRRVGTAGGVTIINDSKGTNVDATVRGLMGLSGPSVLIAGGSSKGADFAPLAEALAAKARALVVLGQTADTIAEAARKAGVRVIERARDMETAVGTAFSLAQPGDYLVLSPACASFDMFENYRERGDVFERAAAKLPDFRPADEQ